MTTTILAPARTITTGMRLLWQGRELIVLDAHQEGARWSITLHDGQHLLAPWDAPLDVVRKAA